VAPSFSIVRANSLFRLNRSVSDYADLVALCVEHRVPIRLVHEGEQDFTTASGRFTSTILAAAAQMQRELDSERQKARHAGRAAVLAALDGPPMTRVRRRVARSMTEEADWEHGRSEVLRWHGSQLERYQRFWDRESGIPPRLRRHVIGYLAYGGGVLAPDPGA
jgi:DNA invertase Pin-like site-specific DNA recombinase